MNHSHTLPNLILKTLFKIIIVQISVLHGGETVTQEKEVI